MPSDKTEPSLSRFNLSFKVSTVAALVGIILSFSQLFNTSSFLRSVRSQEDRNFFEEEVRHRQELAEQIRYTSQQTHELDKRIVMLTELVSRASLSKPGQRPQFLQMLPQDRERLEHMTEAIAKLGSRMSSIESGLSLTPEKTLALPLLKQQVDTVQDRYRADIQTVHDELSRQSNIMIGTTVTLGISILGFLYNQYRRPQQESGR